MKENSSLEGLCVVLSGEAQARGSDSLHQKAAKTLSPGQTIGELALLHESPLPCSLVASSDLVLACLDRETFTRLAQDLALRRRKRNEALLAEVQVLALLSEEERSRLSEALKVVSFRQGELIYREARAIFARR